MFTFKSSDKSTARDMKAAIESTIYGSADAKMSSSVKKTMNSLQIKIVGYGLGLDDDGSDTLVATVSTHSRKVIQYPCCETLYLTPHSKNT